VATAPDPDAALYPGSAPVVPSAPAPGQPPAAPAVASVPPRRSDHVSLSGIELRTHEQDPYIAATTPAPTTPVASLSDVPLLSAGEVDALIGPIVDLTELDQLDARIRSLHGVADVHVVAFEGQDVLLSIRLDQPLPLASMLRTELGRPVASCRLVEGRIVVGLETHDTAS
jgi:hypothetical protein